MINPLPQAEGGHRAAYPVLANWGNYIRTLPRAPLISEESGLVHFPRQ